MGEKDGDPTPEGQKIMSTKEQKMIFENFRRWQAEPLNEREELLEEGFVMSVMVARSIATAMQAALRTETGRNQIKKIPRYGNEILGLLDKSDNVVQTLQDFSSGLKNSEHMPVRMFYKVIYYPFLLIAFAPWIGDPIGASAAELVRFGANLMKKKLGNPALEEKERQELEKLNAERVAALTGAEEMRDNLLMDIPGTASALEMDPEDVKNIRVGDPDSEKIEGPFSGKVSPDELARRKAAADANKRARQVADLNTDLDSAGIDQEDDPSRALRSAYLKKKGRIKERNK